MANSSSANKLRTRGFQVVEPLKGSGHATIFRVRESTDPSSEAFVAKVVSLTGLDAKGRAAAQQEVSLLKGFAAHPHLIAYRESFLEEAGMLYIVMSLAEDGDLRRVVTESQTAQRVLPEPIVLTWMQQTLSGLEHLHSQCVVHRDLKSSNIFLCEGRRRIRIGDFGISRVLESTDWASSCVGTPAYMSPELMRNERYDYHVDMWAMGCICFELCTLQLPFPARSLLELACQVMEQDPNWSQWAMFSQELRDVAVRLLSKDMDSRPTAAQLLNEDPLFMAGGRGSLPAPEEAWALVAPLDDRSTDKLRPVREQSLGSAVTTDAGGNSSDGWTMTPRMPWESSSRGSDSIGGASPGGLGGSTGGTLPGGAPAAAGAFAGEMQRAHAEQHEYSKEEFSVLLSTLTSTADLTPGSASRGVAHSGAVGGSERQEVVESVV